MAGQNDASKPVPAENAPPADLPVDPRRFWSAPAGAVEPISPEALDATPALKQLGPLPIAGSGFPLMGFLATVYEQVADHVIETSGEALGPEQPGTP